MKFQLRRLHFQVTVKLLLCYILFPVSAFSSMVQDTARINQWIQKADSLLEHTDTLAFTFIDSAITLSANTGYSTGLGYGYMTRGLAWDYKGEVELALRDYDTSIQFFNRDKYDKGLGQAYSNKGVCLLFAGRYDESVSFLLESLPYMKKSKYSRGTATVLNNLGLIARRKGEYTNALDYYLQSIEYKEKINDQKGLMYTYTNISSLYYYLHDLKESYRYNKMASKIAEETNDQVTLLENELHRATLLNDLGNKSEAVIVFKDVIQALQKQGALENLGIAYSGLGKTYFEIGLSDSSEKYFLTALETFNQLDVADYRLETYKGLADLYSTKGNFEKAHLHLTNYIQLKEQIDSSSRSDRVKELESKYQYLSQKERIDRLKKEKEISELKAKRSGMIQRTLWISALVLVLIILIILLLNRQIRKEKNKTEIALKDKEVLLKEIHHRVKNNLQMISSLLYLQADDIEDDNALNAINSSRLRVESMAIIHQKLYREDDITSIDAENYIRELIDLILETLHKDDDEIIIHKEIQPIKLDIDTMIPIGLIMNELITNSVKHAFPIHQKEKIMEVKFFVEGNSLFLEVKDNGNGNPDLNKKMSSGFGTRLIHLLLRKLDGEQMIIKENGYLVKIEIKKFKLK